MLREELDGPVAGPMDADLRAGHDSEAVLEADLCAAVEPEELTGEIAEIAGTERARESMRDAERAAEARDLQGRGQPDDREVRLRRIHRAVVGHRFVLRIADGRLVLWILGRRLR